MKFIKCLCYFLIFSCVFNTTTVFPQNPKQWLKYKFPHIIAENSLWIGTPNGLYQYHYEEDTWSIFGESNGLPSNNILVLQWDGEFLWVITPSGLAYGDIKLNKWIKYTKENGLQFLKS